MNGRIKFRTSFFHERVVTRSVGNECDVLNGSMIDQIGLRKIHGPDCGWKQCKRTHPRHTGMKSYS